MSVFTRRREQDEQTPRPGETPAGTPAHPIQPHGVAETPTPPRTAPADSQGTASIGRTFTIKGEIRSEEDLRIDGQVEGQLDLGLHRLVVGAGGHVRAVIQAREVDVHGAVSGNVTATEKIILRKNSKLVGDLKMASVEIEDGAYFKGSIDITRPKNEAT